MMDLTSVDLSSPWAYGAIVGLALVDGVVPLVPARSAVIGIGVIAGAGDKRAYPLLALATAAAFISDNISYWIGAHVWAAISGRVLSRRSARRSWGWVEDQLRRHGPILVALARVLPGGPTPITLSAGSIKMPIGQFRKAAAVSAGLWSAYAFGVGLAGDALVGDNLLVAFIVALVVAGLLNIVLRAVLRRRQRLTRAAEEGDLHASG